MNLNSYSNKGKLFAFLLFVLTLNTVKAQFRGGKGDGQDFVSNCPTLPSGVLAIDSPTKFLVTPISLAVRIGWDSVFEANQYDVYISSSSNGTLRFVGTTVDTFFFISNLSADTTYYIALKARYRCGLISNFSSRIPATPLRDMFKGGIGDGFNSVSNCFNYLNGLKDSTPINIFTAKSWINRNELAWKPVSYAKTYIIKFDTSASGNLSKTINVKGKDSTFRHDSLIAHQTYRYSITIEDSCGNLSKSSNIISAKPIGSFYVGGGFDGHAANSSCRVDLAGNLVKDSPQNLKIYPGAALNHIVWNKVFSADSYQVAFSTVKNGSYTNLPFQGDNFFTHENLQVLTKYYYKVRAKYTCGALSPFSVIDSGITAPQYFKGGKADGANTALGCQTFLNGLPDSTALKITKMYPWANQIEFAWQSIPQAAYYEIYWDTASPSLNSNKIGPITTNSYIHTGRTPYIKLHYKVRAIDSCGYATLLSKDTSATPVANFYIGGGQDGHAVDVNCYSNLNGTPIVTAPANFTAIAGAAVSYLSWNAVLDAQSYTLSYSTSGGGPLVEIQNIKDTFFLHENLTPYTTYNYTVQAVYKCGVKTNNSGLRSAIPASNYYVGKKGRGDKSLASCYVYLNGNSDSTQLNWKFVKGWTAQNELAWNKKSDAASYEIYWDTIPQVTLNSNKIDNIKDTQYVHKISKAYIKYYYRVRAVDTCGKTTLLSKDTNTTPIGNFYSGGVYDGHALGGSCLGSLNGVINRKGIDTIITISSSGGNVLRFSKVFEASSYTILWDTTNTTFSNSFTITDTFTEHRPLKPLINYYYKIFATLPCGAITDTNARATSVPGPNTFGGGKGDGHSIVLSCLSLLNGKSDTTVVKGFASNAWIQQTQLSWNKKINTNNYVIIWDTSQTNVAAGRGKRITIAGKDTVYTHTNLTPHTNYYYTLRGIDSCGDSSILSPVRVSRPIGNFYVGSIGDGHSTFPTCFVKLSGSIIKDSPKVVTTLSAPVTVYLRWSSILDADSYRVSFKRGRNGSIQRINGIKDTIFIHNNLVALDTYFYTISATYKCGEFTNESKEVIGIPSTNYYVGGSGDGHTYKMSCLSLLNGKSDTTVVNGFVANSWIQSNQLTWNKKINTTSYTIYWDTTQTTVANGRGNRISVQGKDTIFNHTGLTPYRTYYYTLRGMDSCGDSSILSPVRSGRPIGNFYTGGIADGHATNRTCFVKLNGSNVTDSPSVFNIVEGPRTVYLSWSPVFDADSYRISYRRRSNPPQYVTISGLKYQFDSLLPLDTYYYSVSAFYNCANIRSKESVIRRAIPLSNYFIGGSGDGHSKRASECITLLNGKSDTTIVPGFRANAWVQRNDVVWNKKFNTLRYILFWDTTQTTVAAGRGNRVVIQGKDSTFRHDSLVALKNYYYTIKAIDSCGDSSIISPVRIGRPIGNFYVGGTFDGHASQKTCYVKLNGTNVTDSPAVFNIVEGPRSVYLSWSEVFDADSYRISYRRRNGTIQYISTANRQYKFDSLIPLDTYYYTVSAFYKCANLRSKESVIRRAIPLSNYFVGGRGDGHSTETNCLGFLNGKSDTTAVANFVAASWINQNKLSWTPKLNTRNYLVIWDTSQTRVANGLGDTITLNGSASSFTHDSLTPQRTYYYVIKAFDSCGNISIFSAVRSGRPIGNFYTGGLGDGHNMGTGCGTNLNGTVNRNGVDTLLITQGSAANYLRWTRVADAGSYTILFDTASTGYRNAITGIKDTILNHEKLIGLKRYYYKIFAILNCGIITDSNAVNSSVTGPNTFAGGRGDGHSVVGGCELTLNGAYDSTGVQFTSVAGWTAQVQLKWRKRKNAQSYILFYDTIRNSTRFSITGIPDTVFSHLNVKPYKRYYYRVAVVDSCGNISRRSNFDSAIAIGNFYAGGGFDGHASERSCYTTLGSGPVLTAPSKPILAGGGGEVYLRWNSVLDAGTYQIEYSLRRTGPFDSITNITDTIFTHRGLIGDTTYYYRLRVRYICGNLSNPTSLDSVRPIKNFFVGGKGDGFVSKEYDYNGCGLGYVAAIKANNPTNFCDGDSVHLTSGVSGFRFQWTRNGLPVPGANLGDYYADSPGTYRLVILGGICSDTTNAVILNKYPSPPNVISTSASRRFCKGDSILISASTATGLRYQWRVNGQLLLGDTFSTIYAKIDGVYSCDIITANCVKATNEIQITVDSIPSTAIKVWASTNRICQGDSVKLSAPVSAPGYYGYQWYKDNQAITNAFDSFIYVQSAGTYKVEIIAGQCTKTSANQTIILDSLPSKSLNITNQVLICKGDSFILQAQNRPSYAYQWFFNNQPISGARSSSYAAKKDGNYLVQITNGGCQILSDAIALRVDSILPIASVFAANDTFKCAGDSVLLIATNNTQYKYQWLVNGNEIAGATKSQYFAKTTGLHSVRISLGGCPVVFRGTFVTIDSFPPKKVTVSGNTTSICNGDSVKLSVANVSAYRYQWFDDGTLISGAVRNEIWVKKAGRFYASISLNKCQVLSDVVVTNILPAPQDTIAASGNTTICQDDTVTLFAVSNPSYTYQWFLNGAGVVGGTQSFIKAYVSGKYKVIITGNNGCVRTTKEVQVNVIQKPDATIVGSLNINVCESDSPTLRVSFFSNVSYQWYRGNQTIGGAIFPTYKPLESGTYAVLLTNTSGCASLSDSVSVTLNRSPKVSLAVPNELNLCYGDSTLITALVDTVQNLQWFRNNQPISGATKTSLVIKNPGFYYLQGANLQCSAKTKTVLVNIRQQLPLPQISLDGDTLICNQNGFQYEWYLNGVILGGVNTKRLIPNRDGTYVVRIIDSNSCSRGSVPYNYKKVSIGNIFKDLWSVSLFPNPSTQFVTLDASVNLKKDYTINIYDKLGKLVDISLVYLKDSRCMFDVSSLSSGNYHLIISDKYGSSTTLNLIVVK